jgi:hypothetical protein
MVPQADLVAVEDIKLLGHLLVEEPVVLQVVQELLAKEIMVVMAVILVPIIGTYVAVAAVVPAQLLQLLAPAAVGLVA